MLLPAPPLYPRDRKPRPRANRPATPVVPVALTLVAAQYQDSTWVRLTFDRPIDIAGLDALAVLVDDGQFGAVLFEGSGGTLLTPATVEIPLTIIDASSAAGVLLSAGTNTGIVAVDDGGTWAGVSNVELPFP
jgi:hypothetical protein